MGARVKHAAPERRGAEDTRHHAQTVASRPQAPLAPVTPSEQLE